jgi:hypothetical protein
MPYARILFLATAAPTGIVCLLPAKVDAAGAGSVRDGGPLPTHYVELPHRSASVQPLIGGQGFIVRTDDGHVETLHVTGDAVLRVIHERNVPGLIRHELFDVRAARARLTPEGIAQSEAQLDALLARAFVAEKAAGGCEAEASVATAAAANVVVQCSSAGSAQGCAGAVSQLGSAVAALTACLATQMEPLW